MAMVAALTLGLIIISLNSFGPSALSPGPLNAKHSTAAHGCGACHSAGHDGFASMVARAIDNEEHTSESLKCTKCHDRGDNPLLAHSLSSQELTALTERAQDWTPSTAIPASLTLSRSFVNVAEKKTEPLACATCHVSYRCLR